MGNGMSFIGYVKLCLGMIKREKLDPKKFTLMDVYDYYESDIPASVCIKELTDK